MWKTHSRYLQMFKKNTLTNLERIKPWEGEIQVSRNRIWDNRYSWRFHCNSWPNIFGNDDDKLYYQKTKSGQQNSSNFKQNKGGQDKKSNKIGTRGVWNKKITLKRSDWDGLDMWWRWEKRGYLRKCYTQKWRENDQEQDPESDG